MSSIREYFTVEADGRETLIYEDASCKVTCFVADFRDKTWWITILKSFDKQNGVNISLSNDKQLEVYQRIGAELKQHGMQDIFNDKYGFIKVISVEDINYKIPLL